MELDLRQDGELTIAQAKCISMLEPSVRLQYNEYIEALITMNGVTGLGWLLRVTCRNTMVSAIHDKFCRIKLLETILSQKETITKVRVDSNSLGLACERVLKKYHSTATVDVSDKLQRWVTVLNLLKSLYLIFISFCVVKVIKVKKTPSAPVVYVDNFLFINSFDEQGQLVDRYFPEMIHTDDQQKFWYVPTLIGIKTPKQYLSLFKSIRSADANFLMKEDWLTLSDYFYGLKQSFSLPKQVQQVPEWNGIDVSECIYEELAADKGAPALLSAILMVRFIQRIQQQGVEVEWVLDWFENQVIDRSLNLGFRQYYPDVKIKGYQGFVIPDYYACKDPTCYEVAAGTIPDEIYVVGEAFVEGKKRYCQELEVSVAPAFRFSSVHQVKRTQWQNNRDILIVLPIAIKDSREIIRVCRDLTYLVKGKYRFIVKPHPSYAEAHFKRMVPESGEDCFVFSTMPLYEHLAKSRLLISAFSSVCLEAALLGVPVVIVGSRSGPVMNSLSGIEGLDAWQVCYDAVEIQAFLNESVSNEYIRLDRYFQPVTQDNITAFLKVIDTDKQKVT
jgi:hypothetical protein